MITEKTVYIVSGTGEQFDDKAEALRAEEAFELGKVLEAQFGFIYGSDARSVARWILERYELRPDREAP